MAAGDRQDIPTTPETGHVPKDYCFTVWTTDPTVERPQWSVLGHVKGWTAVCNDPTTDYSTPYVPPPSEVASVAYKRNQLGLTQKQLAAKLSIGHTVLRDIESGKLPLSGAVKGKLDTLWRQHKAREAPKK